MRKGGHQEEPQYEGVRTPEADEVGMKWLKDGINEELIKEFFPASMFTADEFIAKANKKWADEHGGEWPDDFEEKEIMQSFLRLADKNEGNVLGHDNGLYYLKNSA